MIYRNFNITTVPAIDLQRHNYSRNTADLCNGFYCEIYRVDDDGMVNRLDDFTLVEGYEIPKATDEHLDRAIRTTVRMREKMRKSGAIIWTKNKKTK